MTAAMRDAVRAACQADGYQCVYPKCEGACAHYPHVAAVVLEALAPHIATAQARAVQQAVAAEREACARVIETMQETITERDDGPFRHVTPRAKNNLAGLGFVTAIRARTQGSEG